MTAIVIRGDARALPLPDASVDLIVTSPPYFALRSYTDGGEHYGGQIGSEATPAEFVAALVECTREMVRVLKPEGSLFVNLGDKYAGSRMDGSSGWESAPLEGGRGRLPELAASQGRLRTRTSIPAKSLLGIPWRYALACTDQLGLILRAEIVWAKPNGLPESVTDRVRRAHEQVFHFTRQPRYYAAVDEVREAYTPRTVDQAGIDARAGLTRGTAGRKDTGSGVERLRSAAILNPLGKLPGSVWTIPSAPLTVPARLGVDHFAAFPPALVRPIVLGWSPPGVCVACGQGRRPVVTGGRNGDGSKPHKAAQRVASFDWAAWKDSVPHTITGYVCACTPYTDHPGTGESIGPSHAAAIADGSYAGTGANWGGRQHLSDRPRTGPRREYHFDQWWPPPTRPAVVLDPFGGTGTTALVATVHGRTGITIDRSADYCRLAQWRVNDPGERARALDVPKPPPVPDDMDALF